MSELYHIYILFCHLIIVKGIQEDYVELSVVTLKRKETLG